MDPYRHLRTTDDYPVLWPQRRSDYLVGLPPQVGDPDFDTFFSAQVEAARHRLPLAHVIARRILACKPYIQHKNVARFVDSPFFLSHFVL